MFRYITSIIILIAFATQTFQKGGILLGYYLNSSAYAKNCINKAKPVMKCKGKCQVMKKLQEEEKKDQQLPQRKLDNKTEVFSSKSFFATISLIKFNNTIAHKHFSIEAEPQNCFTEIFHPPSLV